jgi:hypothetical protein
MKEIPIGQLFGLRISFSLSAGIGLSLLWAALASLARFALGLPIPTALGLALAATFLHGLSELVHQLGHAHAAWSTGYPMTGIRFWTIFSASVYPVDEPQLPARVHIRRALGGPTASAVFSLLSGVMTVMLPSQSLPWWLALFVTMDNLLTFTLQMFIPLGFNDGATLLYWLRRR